MIKIQNSKQYDLEERTLKFARNVREFAKHLPRSPFVVDDIKQLIRSSGSIGANYIEANESLSRKDFLLRIKISRKESKESRYWLNLIGTNGDASSDKLRLVLIQEATELMNIFAAILRKSVEGSRRI